MTSVSPPSCPTRSFPVLPRARRFAEPTASPRTMRCCHEIPGCSILVCSLDHRGPCARESCYDKLLRVEPVDYPKQESCMNFGPWCRVVLALALTVVLLAGSPVCAQQHPIVAPSPSQSPASSAVDLDALAQEATGWLTDLIRINTTNPPGDELPAA